MTSSKLISPIIIVGAGRSGSTLLDRVLNAHPEISMIGETRFLAHRLFTMAHEASEGSMNGEKARAVLAYVSQLQAGNVSVSGKTVLEFEKEESDRVVALMRYFFEQLYYLDLLPGRLWGMKEIWNGNPEALDWDAHQTLFPNATWVHLLRNPYTYARSASGWMQREFTDDELISQFRAWKAIYDTSIKLRGADNYFEIKYEDLTASPRQALMPLFSHLGLEWVEDCQVPLQQQWVSTKELPAYPKGYETVAKKCGVDVIMDAYGYRIPSPINTSDQKQPLESAIKPHTDRLFIGPSFNKGVGDSNYWLYNLTTYPSVQQRLNVIFEGKALSGCDFDLLENSRKLKRLMHIEDLLKSKGGEFFVFDTGIAFTPFDLLNPNFSKLDYEVVPVVSNLHSAIPGNPLRAVWGRLKSKAGKA